MLSKLVIFFKSLISHVNSLLHLVFGNVIWTAPAWVKLLGSKIKEFFLYARLHPRRIFLWSGLAALAVGAVIFASLWYKHLPKSVKITFEVKAPPLTKLVEEKWQVEPLSIIFNASVAPLDKVGKTVTSGVEISPKIEGEWKWEGDRRLTFLPKSDWDVGKEYKVFFDKKQMFRAGAKLLSYEAKFSSAPFNLKVTKKEFYQDPTNPNMKKVIVTVNFTHPVAEEDFVKRVRMDYRDQKTGIIPTTEKKYAAHIDFDKSGLNAFLSSDPISLPEKDGEMQVTVDSGVRSSRGGDSTPEPTEILVKVPSILSFLRIQQVEPTIVSNSQFEPEQMIVVDTTIGVNEKDLNNNIKAYLLPLKNPNAEESEQEEGPYEWSGPEDIDSEVLKKSQKLSLEPVPTDKEYSTLHSFKYNADVGRYALLQINKGLKGYGGYLLAEDFVTVIEVPPFQKDLKILHNGSILSLGGEGKVSVYARDLAKVKVNMGRILPDQVHHLVTQTSGEFSKPSFVNEYNFNEENVSQIFTEEIKLGQEEEGKAQYFAVDLNKYINANDEQKKGIFLLKLESAEPEDNNKNGHDDAEGEDGEGNERQIDSRFVIVTDLGIVAKKAVDGSVDVFVQSIRSGNPVAGAVVEVIGKNGLASLARSTDETGRARFPTLKDFKYDQSPVLYLVQKDGDLSFLPYKKADRQLDMSRFDIGGIANATSPDQLSAYLFSDRGLYRPGESINIGMIVRASLWGKKLEGVPLEVWVTDARGITIKKEKIKVGASGFEEFKYQTQENAPTGTYSISLHIVKDENKKKTALLGSVNIRVQEFMPDRMKISAGFLPAPVTQGGWVDPETLKGSVTLENLFGTPAAGKRITAAIDLNPALPVFLAYKDYTFYDPAGAKKGAKESLADVTTNDNGEALFDLNLQRFAKATYRLKFSARGFENVGGRSVAADAGVLVSPLKMLVGYKADGDFSYIKRDSKHAVSLIAIDPALNKIEAKNLKVFLIERKHVSVLTRQDDGSYKYESIRKEVKLADSDLTIPAKGLAYPIATGQPGDFAVEIRDAENNQLARIEYFVAGEANVTRSLEKNAELQITLDKKDYVPGEEIEMQVRAPYKGSGLITIERDKVYQHSWFKADSTNTIQKIKIPSDFEGNGYVFVTFVRDFNSEEIFMSPLSYGSAPFSVSLVRRTSSIAITSPDTAKPGTDYIIKYKVDKTSKIVVFAVDEGILLSAGYKTPNPLGFFFQKRALEVKTSQILDLILPEFKRIMGMAATGGDEEDALGKNLNPFKRKRQGPVVFWSGIVDADPKERQIKFAIPDYFNGAIRVMAVAVSNDAIGVFQKKATVAGDFVIMPNVPAFVAPGDEFDVTVGVTNTMTSSNKEADVALSLDLTGSIEPVGNAKTTLKIAKGKEATAGFRLKAKGILGNGDITFTVAFGDRTTKLSESISVRPPMPYMTTFSAGLIKDESKDVAITRQMYPDERVLKAGISTIPLEIAHGLAAYLKDFPHMCTEQLVSKAFSSMILKERREFGYSEDKARESFLETLKKIEMRQNSRGSFGIWAANTYAVSDLISVYALHFLMEAKDHGYAVSQDVLSKGMKWIGELISKEGNSLQSERIRAYAIYVLTRSGKVTTSSISALQERLTANYGDTWKSDPAALYMASSYMLLKQTGLAEKLLSEYLSSSPKKEDDYRNFYDSLVHDAQAVYYVAKYFPGRLKNISGERIAAMAKYIENNTCNSFNAALSIMALDAYASVAEPGKDQNLSVKEIFANNSEKSLAMPDLASPLVDFSEDATSIRFASSSDLNAFYTVIEKGFDRALPTTEIKQNMEIIREFTDEKEKPVTQISLGSEAYVYLKFRSLGGTLYDVALVDLIPGGFEVVVEPQAQPTDESTPPASPESVDEKENCDDSEGENDSGESTGPAPLPISNPKSTWTPDFADVREDRLLLYGVVQPEVKEFVYKIRATNSGNFAVPPPYGESMYDKNVKARGMGSQMSIVKP